MNKTKIKIGVLGGSFDPAHKGHLAISNEAKKRFKLKKVIWAITKKNPFKIESKTSVADRIKSVSYTHLRAHETGAYLVCRLLLEKKK